MARNMKRTKKPLFPFGDMMLPVLGLVALGLLVFGIRVFFLPDKDDSYEKYVQQNRPVSNLQSEGSKKTTKKNPEPDSGVGSDAVIAVPVSLEDGVVKKEIPSAKPTVPKTAVPRTTSQKKVETRPSPDNQRGSWYVQIGAFQQKPMAQALASDVSKKGFSTVIGEGLVGGTKYYKVWIPGGSSRDTATGVGEKLKKLGYAYFVFSRK